MKATNAAVMKEKNKKLVLDLIRERNLSRAELSQQTGLTKPALSTIVDELLKENIVLEVPQITNEVGRRPKKLYLNREYLYFAGVNITRNHFEAGIINFYGEVLVQKRERMKESLTANEVIEQVCNMIAREISELSIPKKKLFAIGVTTPGPVDRNNTTVLAAPNFNQWHFVNIGAQIKHHFHVPVYLENVSNAWAVCEKYFGTAKEVTNFMVVKIDEGIGSGIILGGSLYEGLNELGHTTINYNGILCECGNRGCLETYASIRSILNNTPYQTWTEAVDAEDTVLIEKEAEYLVPALVNVSNLFSLDIIVLASDIAYKSEQLLSILNARVREKSLNQKVSIVKTKITSSIQSAAVIALDKFFHL